MLPFFIVIMTAFTFANGLPEAVKKLKAFEGEWVGKASMEMAGKPPLNLTGFQNCRLVAKGWALQCEGQFKGPEFELNEAFQGSYDQASDKIIWSVLYSN
ncbi:MAG: DUF1579 family protein, partial [Bdellovibrionales bacterium]|nr:DUF1579 family protein [Bdellovibrionales bacterium]